MKENGKAIEKERLTDEAELLNDYLNRYKHCILKKRILEKRRIEIAQEFDNPLPPLIMNGMPKGGNSSVGCAALSFLMDEINSRIQEQSETSAKILTDIINIIELLPDSLERDIIESKYIDRNGWNWICNEYHISRSPAIRKWRKGLNMLLEFKKVKQILKEYEEKQQKDGKNLV